MATPVVHFVVLLAYGFLLGIEIPDHFSKPRRRALKGGMFIRMKLTEFYVPVAWYKSSAYIEGPNWRHFCALHKLHEGEMVVFSHLGHAAYVAQTLIPKTGIANLNTGTGELPLVSKFSKVIGKSGGLGCKDPRLCRLYIPAAVAQSNALVKQRQSVVKLKYGCMEPMTVCVKVYRQYGLKNEGATIALTRGWYSFCSQVGIER